MQVHVGIDPGASGAVAFVSYDPRTHSTTLLEVLDLPVIQKVLANGKTRRRLDVEKYHGILSAYPALASITIEDVCSRPGEGEVNAFSFGHMAGSLGAVARLCSAKFDLVTPSVWKKCFGLRADKGEARHLAQCLTQAVEPFQRVKDDGRAEAALLAIYAASGGIVEDQSEILDAYRAEQAAKPPKVRRKKAENVVEILKR